jgi:diguanylate cyclase (GGDEF)-like protein
MVAAVPVLAAALVGVNAARRRAQELLQRNATEEAAALGDLIATSFTYTDPGDSLEPAPPATAHRLVAAGMKADFNLLENVSDLRVIDGQGVIRWSRRVEEQGTRLAGAERLLAAPPQGITRPEAGEYVRPLGGMSCARCHAGDAFRLGAVQVLVSRPRLAGEVASFFHAMVAYILAVFAVLVAIIAVSLNRMVTRPLARLVQVMQSAETGDFVVRAQAESTDEIGRLARAFNSMVTKITELKVAEIETSREMESMQRELSLKAELERQHSVIEETNRALARRVREVTLLLDVIRSLNSTLELKEILSLVTEMVSVTTGVDQFSVLLLDPKGEELVVAASFGYGQDQLANFRLPLGAGPSGLAAKTQEPIYLPDIHNDPRYLKGPQDPEGDASLLCVPMVCKDRLVGVLNFVHFSKAAFDQSDIVLLQLVGSQAAMAIVNARLYSETLELTLTDALTGAFNRRHLFARMEMEVARAQRFESKLALVMIDVDHFKHFNDTCGHPAGDQVLKEMSDLLRRTVRKIDTVARYGGEEFMVLLPKSSNAEAVEVAEKLRRAVERTDFENAEKQLGGRITISTGVSVFPDHGSSIESVVDAADSALYASKRDGRNRTTLYEPGMELHPGREQASVAKIRSGSAG